MAKKLKKRKYTRRAEKLASVTSTLQPVKINVNLSKNSVDERAAEALKNVAESIRQGAASIDTLATAALANAQASRDYLKFFNANTSVEAGNVNEQFSDALKQAS